eukprot:Trichotokara_eunicae@DN5729_c0_g1_i1.p1
MNEKQQLKEKLQNFQGIDDQIQRDKNLSGWIELLCEMMNALEKTLTSHTDGLRERLLLQKRLSNEAAAAARGLHLETLANRGDGTLTVADSAYDRRRASHDGLFSADPVVPVIHRDGSSHDIPETPHLTDDGTNGGTPSPGTRTHDRRRGSVPPGRKKESKREKEWADINVTTPGGETADGGSLRQKKKSAFEKKRDLLKNVKTKN